MESSSLMVVCVSSMRAGMAAMDVSHPCAGVCR